MSENEIFISFHEALMRLSHSQAFIDDHRDRKLTALGRLCARLLVVDRVSIWQIYPKERKLVSESLYDVHQSVASADDGSQMATMTILESDHPDYFKALKEARLVEASHARTDPRTRSFLDPYLKPLGIQSMMDAPIFDGGELSGVICIESRQQRNWSLAEISFVASVADTVSLVNTHQAWVRSKQTIEYITHYDTLTGLSNLSSLRNRINYLVEKSQRRHSGTFAIVWVDLDRLKSINDGMGADVGDHVIAETGNRLRELYVPGKDQLARIGGDEFVVLIRSHTSAAQLERATRKIIHEINQPILTDDQTLLIGASIGLCQYPEDGADAETLLRNAEAAMYHAKTYSRGRARSFDSSIQSNARSRFALERELRAAILDDGLDVFYQTIVSATTGQIVGAEALVRWQHPRHGWLSPIEFLDVARNAGLIYGLGECVLKRVCEHYQSARERGTPLPKVSINLASQQVLDPNLPGLIEALCQSYGVPHEDLRFEVTEDAIQGDSKSIRTTLDTLVNNGSALSIDDFGTGYSSLSRLKHLPFSTLKIDRSFIRDLPADEDDCAIILSIIGLARGLGLSVVAEGVETEDQAKWLMQQGCHSLQGYFYSRPVPFETLLPMLTPPVN
ncbi:MAG: sensor domain-containing phosphodiesterase [Marinobacter sp.]|nr:sensor domain-containing phosphodiesterase [Marinobacter sp.]